jgi:hypothetical protein
MHRCAFIVLCVSVAYGRDNGNSSDWGVILCTDTVMRWWQLSSENLGLIRAHHAQTPHYALPVLTNQLSVALCALYARSPPFSRATSSAPAGTSVAPADL